MRYLSVEEILLIHEFQIQKFEGSDGILNLGLLESAVYRPKTAFDSVEKYKTVFEKAASLAYSLIKNHAFVDGNKRTSMVSAIVFLELNGCEVRIIDEELVKLAMDIASSKISIKEVAKFYEDRIL